MVTTEKMNQLIQDGRMAIEYCMVGVVVRPQTLTEADQAELAELKVLAEQYQRLVGKYEQLGLPDAPTANDEQTKQG